MNEKNDDGESWSIGAIIGALAGAATILALICATVGWCLNISSAMAVVTTQLEELKTETQKIHDQTGKLSDENKEQTRELGSLSESMGIVKKVLALASTQKQTSWPDEDATPVLYVHQAPQNMFEHAVLYPPQLKFQKSPNGKWTTADGLFQLQKNDDGSFELKLNKEK